MLAAVGGGLGENEEEEGRGCLSEREMPLGWVVLLFRIECWVRVRSKHRIDDGGLVFGKPACAWAVVGPYSFLSLHCSMGPQP